MKLFLASVGCCEVKVAGGRGACGIGLVGRAECERSPCGLRRQSEVDLAYVCGTELETTMFEN